MSGEVGDRAIRIAHGPRALESELIAAARAAIPSAPDPARLARPVRIVVPSESLRQHVCSALVADAGHSVAGVRVQTLTGLAREVAERPGVAVASPELVEILVRRFARDERDLRDRLDALVDGYAVVYATVRDVIDAGFTPELADPVSDALANLRDVAPPWVGAVLRVAERTARALEAEGLPSDADLHRIAVDRLASDPDAAVPAEAILIHGFADATGVQTDFIAALVRGCGARLFVDRPPDPASPGVPDLGCAFTRRFVERVELAGAATRTSGDWPEPAEVSILYAPGPHAEARAVAERVASAIDEGVPPERIAIIARQIGGYALPLRQQLSRLGVPYSDLAPRGPADEAGRRREALRILLGRRLDTPADRWLDLVAPEEEGGPAGFADLRLALHANGAVRVADVAAIDLDALLGAAGALPLPCREGVAARDDAGPVARHRRLPRARIEAAIRCARAVCARLRAWPGHESAAAHARWLTALVEDDLGWRRRPDPARDLFAPILALADALGDRDLERDEFRASCERALEKSAGAPLGGLGGGVQVLDVMEARGRTFERLFIVGMNRGVFPRTVVEDPLLPDDVRRSLRAVLEDLPVKSDGFDEERYLFAGLLAASPRVVLTAAVTDDDGKARPPSPLAERLRRAPHVGEPERLPGFLAPEAATSALRTPRERAEQAALHGSDRQFAAALRAALAVEPPDGIDAGRWCDARIRTLRELDGAAGPGAWRPGPFFGFTGEIGDDADPRRAPVYATSVEAIARCPWQTFLGRVLRLEVPPDAESGFPETTPLMIGRVVHGVLEDLVRARIPDPPAGLEDALQRRPIDVSWPDGDDLRRWTTDHARAVLREEGLVLPGFEQVLADRALERLDVARRVEWPSPSARVPILAPEVEGRLPLEEPVAGVSEIRFRADRVDRDGSCVRLTDYKVSKPISERKREATRESAFLTAVARGERLQVVAYALAASRAGADAALGRYVFLQPDESFDHARVAEVAADAEAFAAAFDSATAAVLGARARGSFFPRLADTSGVETPICGYCEFKDACLRGDAGARARLAAWARPRAAGEVTVEHPAEAALRALWNLGDAT